MSFIFQKPPSPAPIQQIAPPPERDDPAVLQARADAVAAQRRLRGRRATLIAGASGVDTATANVSRATLLGG